MYLDVTENYYTLEVDVKFFLNFIPQRPKSFLLNVKFSIKLVKLELF